MATNQEFIIRPAAQEDVPSINAILTYYALNTVMTFATTAQPDSALAAKLETISIENRLPFYVATPRPSSTSPSRGQESEISHEVIGICYISPYRPERQAYFHTGEISLFVHHEHHGRGIGSDLLRAVLHATRETRIREVVAIMAVDETGKEKGLALRDYYILRGFRDVGTLEKVGFKFGRLIDVITLQLHVDVI